MSAEGNDTVERGPLAERCRCRGGSRVMCTQAELGASRTLCFHFLSTGRSGAVRWDFGKKGSAT